MGNLDELQELSISQNNIGNYVARNLFLNLSRNCQNLKELYCFQCNFNSESDLGLDKLLNKSKNLTALNISDNALGNDIGKRIFNSLYENCNSIQELKFWNCGFSNGIAEHIAKFIASQTSLKQLSLSRNPIGDGFSKLFDSIYETKSNLTVILFEKCNLTSKIGTHLLKALRKQIYLTTLSFNCNELGDVLGKSIFSTLAQHCILLKNLKCSNCSMSENTTEMLMNITNENEYEL